MEPTQNKPLGVWSLFWISLTSMIGSGWLFGSLYSAHFAGPSAIIAWPIAGFLLLFVAFSYAEVSTMFPEADALARLPFYTHGRLTSIIMSGLTWISLATIPVIETQGLVQYASNYLPHLMERHGIHYSPTHRGYIVEIVILMSFVLLNYFGVRFFARINAAFTLWKLLIPTLTIIILISFSYHAGNFSQHTFMPYGFHGVMAAMSNGGILFSLLGFRQVVIMMGESQNPSKHLPLVLVGSLLLTTLLYTGLQWSFIGSLREQDILHGWNNLSFVGDAGPFAALAAIAGIIWLSQLLYADAFISPFSTGLVYSTTAAHMLKSMSIMGAAPLKVAENNKYEVPWISLIINFILAIAMLLLLHGWQAMASFLVTVMMITYAVGPLSLACLRKQLPNHARPFRLRAGIMIALIGFYVCTAGVYWAGFESLKKLLFLTILGFLILVVRFVIIKKVSHELDIKNAIWLICYLIGLGIFSYCGNYGGIHFIPLYWDLLYLLCFTIIIFFAAIYSSKKQTDLQGQA